MESTKTIAIAILFLATIIWKLVFNRPKVPKVPGIGYGSLPLVGKWQGVLAFMKDPNGTLARGYAQYKDSYFRVSSHSLEYIIVSNKKKIAEYLAAPDDVLSFNDSVNNVLQVEWTMGYGVIHRPYHVPLIRTKFTQSIASKVPAMLFEAQDAMDSLIGSPEQWTEVKLYDTMVKIVARVSVNAFSGMLFCRNEAFLSNAIAYAQAVVISAELIKLFPNWLKPLIVKFTPFHKMQKQARELMGPTVQMRLDATWNEGEKPNDMIQLLIDSAPDVERTMPQIVERMMALNMASIHTTTMTITSAIYMLAAEPDKYVPDLRAEVLKHCIDGKINRQILGKLIKLDSFLRECGRMEPLGTIFATRFVRKDFTFSDGMVIPAGNVITAPLMPIHKDPSNLLDPDVFDGFRYSRMNDERSGPTSNHQLVETDLNYVLFGHGKHSCPGRFLAAAEMKLILATILLRYDLKLVPGTQPKSIWFGPMRIPELKLPILMKTIQI